MITSSCYHENVIILSWKRHYIIMILSSWSHDKVIMLPWLCYHDNGIVLSWQRYHRDMTTLYQDNIFFLSWQRYHHTVNMQSWQHVFKKKQSLIRDILTRKVGEAKVIRAPPSSTSQPNPFTQLGLFLKRKT
jgi:hypothetical protein